MKISILVQVLVLSLVANFACTAADHTHKSKYAGEEKRKIKSLSAADIEELQNGSGWGLAKAAELNGMPGPLHLLEMKAEINLNSTQIQAIEQIYSKMKQQAVPLGLELIELEKELNDYFAKQTITDVLLRQILKKISQVHNQLRYVHLSAHLETPTILEPDQIALYNKLRGYLSDDPCKNIPEGHDPNMWRKHHNCS